MLVSVQVVAKVRRWSNPLGGIRRRCAVLAGYRGPGRDRGSMIPGCWCSRCRHSSPTAFNTNCHHPAPVALQIASSSSSSRSSSPYIRGRTLRYSCRFPVARDLDGPRLRVVGRDFKVCKHYQMRYLRLQNNKINHYRDSPVLAYYLHILRRPPSTSLDNDLRGGQDAIPNWWVWVVPIGICRNRRSKILLTKGERGRRGSLAL